MADWKQITARIRRARGSKNPAEQLSNLFQKTSDAMVAFELGRHFEAAGQNADAAKWYATAAERFRRADWKAKALEAVARLGGASSNLAEPSQAAPGGADFQLTSPPGVLPEPGLPFEQHPEALEAIVAVASEQAGVPVQSPDAATGSAVELRRRGRRGRRGGRNRRRGGTTAPAALGPSRHEGSGLTPRIDSSRLPEEVSSSREELPPRPIPPLPIEPAGEESGPALKGRYGDPGLSSRISLLEMQFRRLLTCLPAKLDYADRAPAGPGVFVLTDEEMTSYYYVEACDTLRVAIANVARGGVSRRGSPSIKPLLAEHLGIPESRIAKYLSDHCVVRWLQLDEGATQFAHFAIAVLRPVLND
jgi:hypothetical protein